MLPDGMIRALRQCVSTSQTSLVHAEHMPAGMVAAIICHTTEAVMRLAAGGNCGRRERVLTAQHMFIGKLWNQ